MEAFLPKKILLLNALKKKDPHEGLIDILAPGSIRELARITYSREQPNT